jgi:hypothetical protein
VALIGNSIGKERIVSTIEVRLNEVEQLAELVGLKLKPGNRELIGPMLADIRASVYRKASALDQDFPSSVFFDARL